MHLREKETGPVLAVVIAAGDEEQVYRICDCVRSFGEMTYSHCYVLCFGVAVVTSMHCNAMVTITYYIAMVTSCILLLWLPSFILLP